MCFGDGGGGCESVVCGVCLCGGLRGVCVCCWCVLYKWVYRVLWVWSVVWWIGRGGLGWRWCVFEVKEFGFD